MGGRVRAAFLFNMLVAVNSANAEDCTIRYEYEGSRLAVCHLAKVWEKPERVLPAFAVVKGIARNESDHVWERVRLVIRFDGSEEGSPDYHFEKVLVFERIPAGGVVPIRVELPFGETADRKFSKESVGAEILDEYTFPRREQLQEVLDREVAAKRAASAAATARQRAKEKRDTAEVDAIIKRTEEAEAKKRAELRAQCEILFGRTANKKVVDLTVVEAQAIDACKAFGFYRPR